MMWNNRKTSLVELKLASSSSKFWKLVRRCLLLWRMYTITISKCCKLFMSISWLYIMSPYQVSGFLSHFNLFYFISNLSQLKIHFNHRKWHENPKKHIFTWNGHVRLNGIRCTKMKWNNQKTTLVQLKLACSSSKV
jgi:hypothetical protein